jgi:multiple sugar transport system ATP-binding protein
VATITLDGIDKIYENGFQAVTDLSLDIADGEFLVLVGPSGCGKSTALRMIAGLESISGGEMRIGERVVNNLEPKDRDIAMVFQSYALYPHLTVRDNIAFALKLQKMPKDEIERRVADAARTLELTDNLDRRPAQLSGGQRQRVAMGRAIVRQPQAFLMDEPLSNLDAKLRVQMRAEIAKIQHDLNVTTVYVTHDQIEAMTMGDRVAVMSKGTLMQVDSPQNLYDHPNNLFVAAFIGSPQMNLLRGKYQSGTGGGTIRLGSAIIALSEAPASLADYSGRDIAVGLRPEHLVEAPSADTPNTISGKVTVREGLGSEVIVHLDVDCSGVDTEEVRDAMEGETTGQSVSARLPPHTPLRIDDTAHLVVNASQLHLFDLETGLAIR